MFEEYIGHCVPQNYVYNLVQICVSWNSKVDDQ